MTGLLGDLVAGVADVLLSGGLLAIVGALILYVLGSTAHSLWVRWRRGGER